MARRLREAGIQVVTCDPAPGMRPDVICRAESLPFAGGSFDVVACRTAAHHFADVRLAVEEMARVSGDRVLLVDTTFMGDDAEEAETLRDPSHVRNYTEAEWRALRRGRRAPDRRRPALRALVRLLRLACPHGLRGRGGRVGASGCSASGSPTAG